MRPDCLDALGGALGVGGDRGHRLGEREDADQFALPEDRGGDVHDRAGRVVGVFARLAGAVFAAQDAGDVAPLREVFADGGLFRVVDDDAVGVGDVDAEVDVFLEHAGNVGLRAAPDGGADRVGEGAVADAVGGEVEGGHFGEDVGGVDQGFLGGLADAGFGFVGDDVEHEPGGQPDDEEIAEKEADGDVHAGLPDQAVAEAAMGHDDVFVADAAQLAAQGLDVGVDGAFEAVAAVLPDAVHDLRAIEDAAGFLEEQGEQQVFVAGQRQPLAVVGDAQAVGVDFEFGRFFGLTVGMRRVRRWWPGFPACSRRLMARMREATSRGLNGLVT
jgi:hypothetical protein